MLTDKDIKKLIKAQKEIFPTAKMVKEGFDDMDTRFNGMDKRFDQVENRLDNLEQGQEDIKLRQDNVAYRFEVEDLKKRTKKLEMKVGLRRA